MAGRRANGDGTIYFETSSGRWVGALSTDHGRRKVKARTKDEVRRRLDELKRLTHGGGSAGDGNITVSKLADQWARKVLGSREHSPATIDTYRWSLALLTEQLGTKRVRALKVEDVENALERLAAAGKSRASLVKVRSVLGQVLAWGERRGVVNRNVARVAELPAAARRTPPGRALTVDEARRLLEAADQDRLAALWATMLLLGLRPGEATGLSWPDVDLERGRIHVRRSLKFHGKSVTLDERLKTSRSRRTLDAPPPLLDRLRRHKAAQAAERLAAGSLWSREWTDLSFTTSVGTPISPSNLRRDFAKVTAAAGLGRWHPHELRHSAASILSAAGVPLERVADILGHDGTRMTALVYRHAVGPSVPDAAPVMGELFG